MKKGFIVYGIAICLVFVYASYSGLTVYESLKSGKWDSKGQNTYHK